MYGVFLATFLAGILRLKLLVNPLTLCPPSLTLPIPPPLSPNNFPSLSETKTVQKSVKTFYRSVTSSTVCKGASPPTDDVVMASANTATTEAASQVADVVMPPTAPAHGSGNVTVHELQSELNHSQTLKTLPPKITSPL